MDVIETVCDDHFTLKYINKYFETNKGYSIKMYLGGKEGTFIYPYNQEPLYR